MTKGNPEFGFLTANQVRDIWFNKGGLTIRQLGRKYGVPVKVINAARRDQQHRRNPGVRGRIALVNA